MRAHVKWTPELDARLRTLRGAGLSWDGAAAAMGLGRHTVLERGRKIGVKRIRKEPVIRAAIEPMERLARCAGHPDSWNLINAGTTLAGTPYPYPVFL